MAKRTDLLQGLHDDRLRLLFDALPAVVAVLRGPDFVFDYANRHYMEVVGRDRTMVGLPLLEALPEIEGQGFVELLRGVVETGEPFYGSEVRVMLDRRSDGELDEAFLNFVYLPTRTVDGTIDGVMAHGVEVTEQVRAREQVEELASDLRVERTTLETIIEHLPVGVVMSDPAGNITAANTVWREFYGVPIDALSDMSQWDVFGGIRPDGSVYAADEYPLSRSLLLGETVIGEPIRFRSAGSDDIRSTEVSSVPIRDDQGRIVLGVGVFSDVTDRVRAHEQLVTERAARAAQARVERVLDSAGDGIWVLDEHGTTVLVNPAALRMTGFTPDELLGKGSHSMVHHTRADGSDYPIEQCPIYRSVFEGEPCEVDDEVFWRKDGTSFPVAYRSTPIYQDDRQIGAVQVFRDLTEQRRLEAERERLRDAEQSRHKAFEINDTIVQRLAVADLAYGMGRTDEAAEAVRDALAMAKRIINEWAEQGDADLTRATPAAPADGIR